MRTRNLIYFRPRKYGNKPCTVDGHRFDSRREADYYEQLKIEKIAGLIKSFERQVEFPLSVNGSVICRHRVDFLVTLPDGRREVREVKGFETAEWNIKRKLFSALNADIEYKVVK